MKSSPSSQDLTILSVNYKDKFFLDANYKLTMSINDNKKFTWLVVDNAPKMSNDSIDLPDERFYVIEGVPFVQKEHIASAGYHHAAALNKGLQYIQTRFVAFLDPDCFLVKRQWIKEVLDYMRDKRLSFFGIPCHPRKTTSYRYFPYIPCLFVDLERVNRDTLNFTPEIDELRALRKLSIKALAAWWITGTRSKEVNENIIPDKSYIFEMLKRVFIDRYVTPRLHFVDAWVGSSGDTGSRIYRKFAHNWKYKHEYVTPVWKIDRPAVDYPTKQRLEESLIRCLLPDSLSAIPKKKGYISSLTFSEFGFYNVENAFDAESYLWQDRPFCFHIRRVGLWSAAQSLRREAPANALQRDVPIKILEEAIDSFIH